VVHNFVLVVGVDEIFLEPDELLGVELGLVVTVSQCVRFQLVGVNGNIPVLLRSQGFKTVMNGIADSPTDDVQGYIVLLECV
jgi:hypothetical protein